MKFTFIGEYCDPDAGFQTKSQSENPDTKTTLEFEAETIDTVLSRFKQFLIGCGYCVDGEIYIEENK